MRTKWTARKEESNQPRYERNRNCKKEVLGTKTDEAPGEEIRLLTSELAILSGTINRAGRVMHDVQVALNRAQRFWGEEFGPDERNPRTVKEWCQHCLALEARKLELRPYWPNSPPAVSTPTLAEIWRTGGVTLYCQAALNIAQRDWHPGNTDHEWLHPRGTLVQWCNDLLEVLEQQAKAMERANGIRKQLLKMGWDWQFDRWRDGKEDIWFELHEQQSVANNGINPSL